ncbi:MAG: tyrosine-type recombinase/integrase [Deltaproteobacteria bacterium]|nr:tyrosine-type recombinase/integrase [Deltaproteobacteria bacterium]
MKLSTCIHRFFDQYLTHIKGVSPQTVKAYRDAFKLLMPFAAKYHGIKIESLRLEHVSSDLILSFLNQLEKERKNQAGTRNNRLAAIKSFAKMIRFIYPQQHELADTILNIPQKRSLKPLVGFLYNEEILKVFGSVDIRSKEGFRDYALLHLLYDSGARASEIADLHLDYFNPEQKTMAILGKGKRFRLVKLEPRTVQLLQLYIKQYRIAPKPSYQHRLFINQRGEGLTRHGIYRICKKYLSMVLPAKRLKTISPVHSFRHSRAMDLLYQGEAITDIKNHLGHDNVQSTTLYLQLDLNHRRRIQKQFVEYMRSDLTIDHKINELLAGENMQDLMAWLDSL